MLAMRIISGILGLVMVVLAGEILYTTEGTGLNRYTPQELMSGKVQDPLICVLPANTPVEVLDTTKFQGVTVYKVRVLKGDCRGEEGWIGAEYLKYRP